MKTNYILEGTMKKVIAVMVMMLAALVTCWAEVVVVPPFQDRGSGLNENDLLNVTDALINAISQTKRFVVPDRDDQARRLQLGEMKFSMSDWADERKTVQMGKMLGADFIVRGVISKYSDGTFFISIRLLEASTSNILGSTSRESANLREIRNQMANIVKELLGDIQTLAEAKREAARRSAEIAQREAERAAIEQRNAEQAAREQAAAQQAKAEAERVAKQTRDAWHNNPFYWGILGGYGKISYTADQNYSNAGTDNAAWGFGLKFQVQPIRYVALEADTIFAWTQDGFFPILPLIAAGTFQIGQAELKAGVGYTVGAGLTFDASIGWHALGTIWFIEYLYVGPGGWTPNGNVNTVLLGCKFGKK